MGRAAVLFRYFNPVTSPLMSDLTPSPVADARKVIASKGTLNYTMAGLVLLFFYMLWADLCIQLMELFVPQMLPLQINALGGSNRLISLCVGIVPSFFGMTMNPFFSFRSDRLRTRLGRRRPYLLASAPLVTLVLVGIGFAPEITGLIVRSPLGGWIGAHPNSIQLGLLTGLVALFYFVNTALQPIYSYLVVDVIPDRYMGRFMALFRVVHMGAQYIFQTFIYAHALEHMRALYCFAGAFFLFGFYLMCWRVKERDDYPPPPHGARLGLVKSVEVYFRECFSKPHYLLMNLRYACFTVAHVYPWYHMTYGIFLYRDSLGISPEFVGRVNGWVYAIAAVILLPIGIICDRFSAVRFMVFGTIYNVPIPLLAFFFMRDTSSFVVYTLLLGLGRVFYDGGTLPLHAELFPRERYGQFGSANQMAASLIAIVTSFLLGAGLDWVTHNGKIADNYRYVFLWLFVANTGGAIFMYLLYRSWKKHGGPDAYVPPT